MARLDTRTEQAESRPTSWAGTQKGEGFEYYILVVGIAIALMIRGSGALSLDRLFTRDTR